MKTINKHALSITLFLLICTSASPLQAANNSPTTKPTPEINRPLLSLSWGDIWNKLRRKKGRKGSRGNDENKEFFCTIAPGKLKDTNNGKQTLVVWNTRPIFIWKDDNNKVRRIEVLHIRSNQVVWRSKTFKPGTSRIIYDGKPLKPGEAYSWREAIPPEQLPSKQSFRIMSAEKRQAISAELNQLKPKGASKEKIILARVEYFARKELWGDALLEMHSVKNPSPELKQKIQQIQSHDFCSLQKTALVAGK